MQKESSEVQYIEGLVLEVLKWITVTTSPYGLQAEIIAYGVVARAYSQNLPEDIRTELQLTFRQYVEDPSLENMGILAAMIGYVTRRWGDLRLSTQADAVIEFQLSIEQDQNPNHIKIWKAIQKSFADKGGYAGEEHGVIIEMYKKVGPDLVTLATKLYLQYLINRGDGRQDSLFRPDFVFEDMVKGNVEGMADGQVPLMSFYGACVSVMAGEQMQGLQIFLKKRKTDLSDLIKKTYPKGSEQFGSEGHRKALEELFAMNKLDIPYAQLAEQQQQQQQQQGNDQQQQQQQQGNDQQQQQQQQQQGGANKEKEEKKQSSLDGGGEILKGAKFDLKESKPEQKLLDFNEDLSKRGVFNIADEESNSEEDVNVGANNDGISSQVNVGDWMEELEKNVWDVIREYIVQYTNPFISVPSVFEGVIGEGSSLIGRDGALIKHQIYQQHDGEQVNLFLHSEDEVKQEGGLGQLEENYNCAF